MPWCVVAWVASFVGLPVHSSSPSSTWLRFFPSPPLGFLPRPRDSPGRVFRCRGVTPWCSLRVSRSSSPVPCLLGTGGPGGVSGRPVRPGFVLGSRLDVPSLGRLRRGCPLFLSAPHSGSPPGFVRRRRLAPDAAVCGVEMPWVPCSRPAVVLLAPCPGSDLGSRPGGAVGHRDPTSTPVPDPGFAPPTRQVVDGSGPACDREARLFASLRPEPVIPRDPSCHVSVRPRGPPGK